MQLLFAGDELYDHGYSTLDELLIVLDGHLARLCEGMSDRSLLDQFDVYASIDHVIGLGFVACQVYVVSTAHQLGLSQADALRIGPVHPNGEPRVALVHHAANLFKHSDAWDDPTNPHARRTLAGVAPMHLDPDDFPMVDALFALVGSLELRNLRLRLVLADLLGWREAALQTSDSSRAL